jgi:hypothetical protein
MTREEQYTAQGSVVDDDVMRRIIAQPKFLPLEMSRGRSYAKVAKIATPHNVFTNPMIYLNDDDPDEDLVPLYEDSVRVEKRPKRTSDGDAGRIPKRLKLTFAAAKQQPSVETDDDEDEDIRSAVR